MAPNNSTTSPSGILPKHRRNDGRAEDNKSDFDAFVKARQKSAQDPEIDWNKQRDEWLAYLNALCKKQA